MRNKKRSYSEAYEPNPNYRDWETRDEEKELIIRFLTGKTDYEPIDFIP